MKFWKQFLKYGMTSMVADGGVGVIGGGGGARAPPLKRAEVQLLLGVGATKFWELLREGAFPGAFRIGREVRVPLADVEAFKKRNRIGTSAA